MSLGHSRVTARPRIIEHRAPPRRFGRGNLAPLRPVIRHSAPLRRVRQYRAPLRQVVGQYRGPPRQVVRQYRGPPRQVVRQHRAPPRWRNSGLDARCIESRLGELSLLNVSNHLSLVPMRPVPD